MSTPKHKKLAREAEQKRLKEQRKREALFASAKPRNRKFEEYKPKEVYVRETPNYPSITTSSSAHATAKRESQQYTGDYITGIATMHKSNLVPVSRGIDAKDYATMRRN